MTQAHQCSVCDRLMFPDVLPGTSRCLACGYFGAAFALAINANTEALDEGRRMGALSALRKQNFSTLLDRLAASEGFPERAYALEVGCGHGWFLQALKERGHRAIGIEPDSTIAAIASAAGHEVLEGYYPSALPGDARFDAIFFNDVFEHLPAPGAVVQHLRRHTADGAWVVVNLPVSDGIIFRTSRLAARIGLLGPYRRMWQVEMPSPHLSYFCGHNLERLFARHGFRLASSGILRTVGVNGLLDRIRYDRTICGVTAYLYYAAALAAVPTLQLLPADIRYFAFRKVAVA